MNIRKDIDNRLDRIEHVGPSMNALEKSRKFKSLQVTKNKLISHANKLKKDIIRLQKEEQEAEKQLNKVVNAMTSLELETTQVVTEHALLRYAERFLGADLLKWHDEILKLPEDKVVRSGNTVVTVFTDKEDHFNLAERESE